MNADRPDLTLFIPCRAGSQRVPFKNTRSFANLPGGLCELKLRQVAALTAPRRILLDSNDATVLELGRAIQAGWTSPVELIVRPRPDALGQSETTTDALIRYALETAPGTHLAWTHVTSPFCGALEYEDAFHAYFTRDITKFDSLMTVTTRHGFFWRHDADGSPTPHNYSRTPLRWPRTQDLPPLFEVNSALFVVERSLGLRRNDRIGDSPLLFPLSPRASLDVDWEEDFELADAIYSAQIRTRPSRRP